MARGELGRVCTAAGGASPSGETWCADNGAFSDAFDPERWFRFLQANADRASTCLFVALPDVVGDWRATLARAAPWFGPVRRLGYRVAIVLQDGATPRSVPWRRVDAVFIGGSTDWKLGPEVRAIVAEAKRRGRWVHMGRVNSERRLRYAKLIGCDSADGTYLSFGPDVNLPRLRGWLRAVNDQGDLFADLTPKEHTR